MARKRRPRARDVQPPRLHLLTADQARWLTDARDTPGGVYVPITAGVEPYELVEAGAAAWREVPRTGGPRGPRDPRPCEWVDRYLVPTEAGLELLHADGNLRTKNRTVGS